MMLSSDSEPQIPNISGYSVVSMADSGVGEQDRESDVSLHLELFVKEYMTRLATENYLHRRKAPCDDSGCTVYFQEVASLCSACVSRGTIRFQTDNVRPKDGRQDGRNSMGS